MEKQPTCHHSPHTYVSTHHIHMSPLTTHTCHHSPHTHVTTHHTHMSPLTTYTCHHSPHTHVTTQHIHMYCIILVLSLPPSLPPSFPPSLPPSFPPSLPPSLPLSRARYLLELSKECHKFHLVWAHKSSDMSTSSLATPTHGNLVTMQMNLTSSWYFPNSNLMYYGNNSPDIFPQLKSNVLR